MELDRQPTMRGTRGCVSLQSAKAWALAIAVSGLGACASLMQPDGPQPDKAGVNAANLELARQYIDNRDYRRAIAYLMPLSKREPANRGVLNLMGTAYLGMGNAEAARESFLKLVAADEDDDDAKVSLAYAQILCKRTADAKKILAPLIEAGRYAYPERAQTNLGLAWMEEGRCDKAIPWFQGALKNDPTLVPAYFNLGRCFGKQGKWVPAAESLRKAVDFCPGCAEPALELAQALSRKGDKKSAVAGLEKLLTGKLEPAEHERARKLLNEVKRR